MNYIYVLSGWEGSADDNRVTIIWLMVGTQTKMHAKARNVIEQSFGILKARWGILRVNSYYPIQNHNCIILGCYLLHNFIQINTDVDPMEDEVPDLCGDVEGDNSAGEDFIDGVDSSQAWTSWRANLAMQIIVYNVMDGMENSQSTVKGKKSDKPVNHMRV
ncbi:hypothetical protein ACS0TY_029260 [Phlomoides rotata]